MTPPPSAYWSRRQKAMKSGVLFRWPAARFGPTASGELSRWGGMLCRWLDSVSDNTGVGPADGGPRQIRLAPADQAGQLPHCRLSLSLLAVTMRWLWKPQTASHAFPVAGEAVFLDSLRIGKSSEFTSGVSWQNDRHFRRRINLAGAGRLALGVKTLFPTSSERFTWPVSLSE